MNYCIVLSGGIGSRVGADIPKQYIEINEKPIIAYTLDRILNAGCFDRLIIVAAEQWRDYIDSNIKEFYKKNNIQICYARPGATRQESIYQGLLECMKFNVSGKDNVLIHDAVRPLLSEELLRECVKALENSEAVMPVLHVNDTIYQSDNGCGITALLERETLYAGQSPEGYRLKRYFEINTRYLSDLEHIRGSSELAYKGGMEVSFIKGEVSNFKITTQEDLQRFAQIVRSKI